MARVLVVEDDETVRGVVAAQLRRGGHRVLDTPSGEQALAALDDRAAPDVAVVDLGLPEMDGFEFVSALRQRPHFANMPVIFLSSRIEPEQIEQGQRLGAVYLTKPIVASALLSAIDRSLPEPAW